MLLLNYKRYLFNLHNDMICKNVLFMKQTPSLDQDGADKNISQIGPAAPKVIGYIQRNKIK